MMNPLKSGVSVSLPPCGGGSGWGGSRRRAFTLVEVMVVSALGGALAMLLAQAWSGLGRPLVDAAAHARLAEEASLAVASLTRDLGGYSGGSDGRLGGKTQLRFVGRMQPGGAQLWLCFDGGPNPNGLADWGVPDTVISYSVVSGALVRWDQSSGQTFTVARNVNRLEVTDLGSQVQIRLTFQYRNTTHVYTFIAKDP
jgi:prepilin-type N-terminal cleavage/methylation domain-containing protein